MKRNHTQPMQTLTGCILLTCCLVGLSGCGESQSLSMDNINNRVRQGIGGGGPQKELISPGELLGRNLNPFEKRENPFEMSEQQMLAALKALPPGADPKSLLPKAANPLDNINPIIKGILYMTGRPSAIIALSEESPSQLVRPGYALNNDIVVSDITKNSIILKSKSVPSAPAKTIVMPEIRQFLAQNATGSTATKSESQKSGASQGNAQSTSVEQVTRDINQALLTPQTPTPPKISADPFHQQST